MKGAAARRRARAVALGLALWAASPLAARAQAPDPALNRAGLAVTIEPAGGAAVGTRFKFVLTTAQPGYLVIMDVNAAGAVTQIYPNVFSLKLGSQVARAGRDPCGEGGANTLSSYGLAVGGNPKSNYVEPGHPFELPGEGEGRAYAFQACPPKGRGFVAAILSDRPVQLIDLPDVPAALVGQQAGFDRFVDALRSLRLLSSDDPGQDGKPPRWSVSRAAYEIR